MNANGGVGYGVAPHLLREVAYIMMLHAPSHTFEASS